MTYLTGAEDSLAANRCIPPPSRPSCDHDCRKINGASQVANGRIALRKSHSPAMIEIMLTVTKVSTSFGAPHGPILACLKGLKPAKKSTWKFLT